MSHACSWFHFSKQPFSLLTRVTTGAQASCRMLAPGSTSLSKTILSTDRGDHRSTGLLSHACPWFHYSKQNYPCQHENSSVHETVLCHRQEGNLWVKGVNVPSEAY